MTGAFLLAVFVFFVGFGFVAPFVSALGYMWIDIAQPQRAGYGLIQTLPLSFIMAGFALMHYLAFDRKYAPKISGIFLTIILFAAWISLTTTWAVFPGIALQKWDWAFKGLLFAAFMPFVFRSRVQIEAALLVLSFSLSVYYLPGVVKSIINPGYGNFVVSNSGISESSTLSLFSAMSIPMNIYFIKNSIIFSNHIIWKFMFAFMAACCFFTVIGTYARTGLIALGILAIAYFLFGTKRRFRYLVVVFGIAIAALSFAPDAWFDRMQTIETYEGNSSAMSRIAVWAWTIEYSADNPLGGGFGVYRLNRGEYFGHVINKTAFHSAYFEVLGEHGVVGLVLFLTIFILAVLSLRRIMRLTKDDPQLGWLNSLARVLLIMIFMFLGGASFIGVAFQPFTYYLVSLVVCLNTYYQYALQEPDAEYRTKLPLRRRDMAWVQARLQKQ